MTGHYESWWELNGIRHLVWRGTNATLIVEAIGREGGKDKVEEKLEAHITGGPEKGGYTGKPC